MEPSFYLVGPKGGNDEPTYWNVDHGWVESLEDASPLTSDILTQPLPPGVSTLLLLTPGEGVAQLDPIGEEGSVNFFAKSY
jgi:hypothetical protein